jgi:hypothetical protein
MLKLTDVTNNPIGEASLKITDNNNQKTVSTDNQGIVNIAMDEGSHNVSIQYEGNETFNPSETTINVITEDNYQEFSEYKFIFEQATNGNYYFVRIEQTK